MKHIFIIFLTLISTSAFSQTTLEEYNYVTKGYRVQMEAGLDMKKGYVFEDVINEKTYGERAISAKALYKLNGQSKQKVAVLIIYTRNGNDPEYICVPQPNSGTEINQRFWDQLYNGESDNSNRLQLIAFILGYLINWK